MEDVPQTPWHRATASRRAQRSERQLARSTGGRQQPASGAFPGRKGDVIENGFLVDDKFTDHKSYTLTVEQWRKISMEAAMTPPGLRPRMRITLPDTPRLCVMLEEDYLAMMAHVTDID